METCEKVCNNAKHDSKSCLDFEVPTICTKYATMILERSCVGSIEPSGCCFGGELIDLGREAKALTAGLCHEQRTCDGNYVILYNYRHCRIAVTIKMRVRKEHDQQKRAK